MDRVKTTSELINKTTSELIINMATYIRLLIYYLSLSKDFFTFGESGVIW